MDVRSPGLLPIRVEGAASPRVGAYAARLGRGGPSGGVPEEATFAPFVLWPGQQRLVVLNLTRVDDGALTLRDVAASVVGVARTLRVGLSTPSCQSAWVPTPRRTGRLACLALSLPIALLPAAPASASCVPSQAAVSPAGATPGQLVTVSSTTWFGICNDTGQRVDVTDRAVVTFVQGGQRVALGQTNSNAQGVFSLEVRVPERAAVGAAVLEVRGRAAADDVPLTVTAAALPRTGGAGAVPAALLTLGAIGTSLACRRRRR